MKGMSSFILCTIPKIISIWIFYMWILSETPYEIDDWSWGISEGWHALVTGELNGRYLSNLLEVIVSRSPLMKTLFATAHLVLDSQNLRKVSWVMSSAVSMFPVFI